MDIPNTEYEKYLEDGIRCWYKYGAVLDINEPLSILINNITDFLNKFYVLGNMLIGE